MRSGFGDDRNAAAVSHRAMKAFRKVDTATREKRRRMNACADVRGWIACPARSVRPAGALA